MRKWVTRLIGWGIIAVIGGLAVYWPVPTILCVILYVYEDLGEKIDRLIDLKEEQTDDYSADDLRQQERQEQPSEYDLVQIPPYRARRGDDTQGFF